MIKTKVKTTFKNIRCRLKQHKGYKGTIDVFQSITNFH